MPRRLIRRYLPNLKDLRDQGRLGIFGKLLDDPFLLHLNRRSVAGGVGLGVFTAFLPIPMQMVVAAALAIVIRVNLLVSVVTVWISNPVTMGPLWYFGYRVGARILGTEIERKPFEVSLAWVWDNIAQIWAPLILGCVVVGLIGGTLGYFLVHGVWRVYLYRHLYMRRLRKRSRKPNL